MPAPISTFYSTLLNGLIVSCQAPADSPLHQPEVIAAMAEAAVQRGAVGVRIDSPSHVRAVRARVSVPIIGLWKQQIPGCDVYITPRLEDAQAIVEAGADIIAIDATTRPRPNGETVAGLVAQIHQLGKAVMADVDTLESGLAAAAAGVDWIGTTLYGYTAATAHLTPPGWDLLSDLAQQLTLAQQRSVPLICEGGISSPQMAQRALELGAEAVVVGTAITGIDALVVQYCNVLNLKTGR
ncbi:MAG: N-acetylmannosamine-6-phosphate 2-epimerase [Elainella sp.]